MKGLPRRNSNQGLTYRWHRFHIISILLIFKGLNASLTTSSSLIFDDIFPNPRTQFLQCNRKKPSSICDPDDVLNVGEADKLDSFANEMLQETPCLCSTCKAENSGVKIGILVRRTLGRNHPPLAESDVKNFTRQLRKKWYLGPCFDDIVILLLTGSKQSSFDMGITVQHVISPQLASKIFDDCSGHFTNGNYYQGLESMINSYRDVLQKFQKIRPVRKKAGSIIGIALGVCILVIIVIVAIALRCWRIRKGLRKSNSKYSYSAAENIADKEEFKLYSTLKNKDINNDLNSSSSSDEGIDSDAESEKLEIKISSRLTVPPKFSNNRGRQLSDVAEEGQDDDETEILKYAMTSNPRNNCDTHTEL